jgi:hypothetical protein
MHEINLFSIFVDRLNNAEIKFFIGGSVASIVYGEPRLTHDIDLVLFLNKDEVKSLIENFPIDEFYSPPEDVIHTELKRGAEGHFNIIHHSTGFKADIYFVGNDKLQTWAFDNKKEIEFDNLILPVAPPEYIIVKKLLFYKEGRSEKHLTDIKGILNESFDLIDHAILKDFLIEYNFEDIYNNINIDPQAN